MGAVVFVGIAHLRIEYTPYCSYHSRRRREQTKEKMFRRNANHEDETQRILQRFREQEEDCSRDDSHESMERRARNLQQKIGTTIC